MLIGLYVRGVAAGNHLLRLALLDIFGDHLTVDGKVLEFGVGTGRSNGGSGSNDGKLLFWAETGPAVGFSQCIAGRTQISTVVTKVFYKL